MGLKSYFYLSELCLDRTSASAAATASAHCGILPYYYITEVNHLLKFLIKQVRAEGPMEHIAQGKRSDTLGHLHSRVSAPCKGKSFNPLCCYSYLIADLAVLKRSIVCIFCSTPAPCPKAFALTGRVFKIGIKNETTF